jgi:hypothetical protein
MDEKDYVSVIADALRNEISENKRPNWATRQLNKIRVYNILQEEKDHMTETGDIVKAYNAFVKEPGQKGYSTNKLDDFYHKRGMYRAAQLGADAADFALWLGRQKENLYDYPLKKYWYKKNEEEIKKDSQKDLQNNINAVIISLKNPGVPVDKMIPHEGTTAGAWDSRFRGQWVKQ